MNAVEQSLERLIEISDKIKALEKEAAVEKEILKIEMQSTNVNKLHLASDNSRYCSLSTTMRKTCKDKPGLLTALLGAGARHCVKTEVTPDIDVLKDEIDTNPQLKAIYDNYVSESAVNTFRIK